MGTTAKSSGSESQLPISDIKFFRKYLRLGRPLRDPHYATPTTRPPLCDPHYATPQAEFYPYKFQNLDSCGHSTSHTPSAHTTMAKQCTDTTVKKARSVCDALHLPYSSVHAETNSENQEARSAGACVYVYVSPDEKTTIQFTSSGIEQRLSIVAAGHHANNTAAFSKRLGPGVCKFPLGVQLMLYLVANDMTKVQLSTLSTLLWGDDSKLKALALQMNQCWGESDQDVKQRFGKICHAYTVSTIFDKRHTVTQLANDSTSAVQFWKKIAEHVNGWGEFLQCRRSGVQCSRIIGHRGKCSTLKRTRAGTESTESAGDGVGDGGGDGVGDGGGDGDGVGGGDIVLTIPEYSDSDNGGCGPRSDEGFHSDHDDTDTPLATLRVDTEYTFSVTRVQRLVASEITELDWVVNGDVFDDWGDNFSTDRVLIRAYIRRGESVGRVTVQKLGEYLSARAEYIALEQRVLALKDKVVS